MEQIVQSILHSNHRRLDLMAKIDKRQYTKEQWKVIREQRRAEKEQERLRKAQESVPVQTDLPKESVEHKNYVVCLKHGKKYGPEYVNTLARMVKRNLTIPYTFVCFTEDTTGIDKSIVTYPLPALSEAHGWWYKPMFFNKDLPVKGNILYMDLDVVVFRNINKLFTFNPEKFCIIRDFNRSLRSDWKKMNSSVFRYQTGTMHYLYDEFARHPKHYIHRMHGDQDYIHDQTKRDDFVWWPDEWIQSYKWEMRDRRDLIRIDGKRNFKEDKPPIIKDQTAIAVFHGEPHPHDCNDSWVTKNWV